jgi:hypothetical protein
MASKLPLEVGAIVEVKQTAPRSRYIFRGERGVVKHIYHDGSGVSVYISTGDLPAFIDLACHQVRVVRAAPKEDTTTNG